MGKVPEKYAFGAKNLAFLAEKSSKLKKREGGKRALKKAPSKLRKKKEGAAKIKKNGRQERRAEKGACLSG